MLLGVTNEYGQEVFQMLEAPGEDFFKEHNDDGSYMLYLQQIFQSDRRKIYIIFLDLEWVGSDSSTRAAYTDKIRMFLAGLGKNDSVIWLCNKADIKESENFFNPNNRPKKELFIKAANELYPNLIENTLKGGLFSNNRKFDFEVFSSGRFPKGSQSRHFVPGWDYYPQTILDTIKKNISGGWF